MTRTRLRRFWSRHRTLFWTLHSLWALATGVVVIVLARERYGFIPWVVLFLVLTWASTLYFGRRVEDGTDEGDAAPDLGAEATSYLTRSMYQETMFFLLPFYAYSTVLGSPNVLFTGALAVLAVLSCLDLLFDRWLRSSAVAGLLFFAVVSFAAVNLLLPTLLPMDPTLATQLAAGIAIVSSLPLALRVAVTRRRTRAYLGLAMALFLGVALGVPQVVPPVPLRLESATFSNTIDAGSLELGDTLGATVDAAAVGEVLVLLSEVFAPAVVPTRVTLTWERDGEVVRQSRDIEISAHNLGFRVWDSWRPMEGRVPPGEYVVYLRASSDRVFGAAEIRVVEGLASATAPAGLDGGLAPQGSS